MNNYIKHTFENVITVENIITAFYMELSKDFYYSGESHDFWELVYIDKGEMICTVNDNKFMLKSGELTFHKPNEFHNLSGTGQVVPYVCILSFECSSEAMKYFEGKIFHLDKEEKALISLLLREALSCYNMYDEKDPLLQRLVIREDAPFGSSQMTKNFLEAFLIMLQRNKKTETKQSRNMINGTPVPEEVDEIIKFLSNNLYSRVTLKSIADFLGKSESTIKKQFSAYMKTGIIDYYNELKIREAKRLICEDKYNFAEISDMLKFDTPQYFSKCFKKRMGFSPREYKKSVVK